MTDSREGNSYRSIIRNMSMFGSVQIMQIIISLARGKCVAAILGPAGMGVSALFASSSLTLQRFSSLGLNLAIVREVASSSDDPARLQSLIAAARRLLTITSVAAAILCMIFSRWLSMITFGDDSMQFQFLLLGLAVGLSVAYTGWMSLLQGLHEVKRISRASIVGGLTGLLAGVPLYYFFGTQGIVPAMIILALALYIFYSRSFSQSGKGSCAIDFNWRSHKNLVKGLITSGILLMSADLLLSLTQYLINIFINSRGSAGSVGLYQAANSITSQYSGAIFAVMAMDFFPRLSKVADDNRGMCAVVNRQLIVTGLVVAPASGLIILTTPLIIRLLLSPEFLPVTDLMRWLGLGLTIRAMMTPLGYISFAKGNRRLFFWMEGIGCNLLTLTLSCGAYQFFGLIGLGYAFAADNAVCLLIYYIVNKRLYNFRFTRSSLTIIAGALTFSMAIFSASTLPDVYSYPLMTLLLIPASAISVFSLRKLRHIT